MKTNGNYIKVTAIALGAAILCAGCTDPKAPNEANFKTLVQKHLDSVYPKCYHFGDFGNFPVEVETPRNRAMQERMSALAKVGALTEKEVSRKEKDKQAMFDPPYIVKYSYDLTDEGRKYYKKDVMTGADGKKTSALCFGKATVVAVPQFTEPADMLGKKMSEITYTYTVTGVPEWVGRNEVLLFLAGSRADLAATAAPATATLAAVLTNNGWVTPVTDF